MQVQLGTISKRLNSTKNSTNFTSYTGTLKEQCDIRQPMIEFNFGNTNPCGYNYMYIPDFGRYYYITWEFRGSAHWYAKGQVDVLASAKADIGRSSKYVIRAESEENEDIIDTKYPALLTGSWSYAATSPDFASDPSQGGAFVVGVVGGYTGNSRNTGITYYVLNGGQMQAFMSYMFNDNDMPNSSHWDDFKWYIDFTSTSQNLPWKLMVNPFQYVTSCIWLPFTPAASWVSTVKFAWFLTDVTGHIPDSATNHKIYSVDCSALVTPPAGKKKWEMAEPYSEYYINVPFCGLTKVPAIELLTGNHIIGVQYIVDIRTGAAYAEISGGMSTFAKLTCQMGIPMPLGGAKLDYAGIASGAVQTLASLGSTVGLAASGNPMAVLSGLSTIRNGVSTALEFAKPQVTTAGSAGSCAGLGDAIIVWRKTLDTADKDPSEFGYPLCKTKTISSLSGFIQCSDGDLECSLTGDEMQEIAKYLTEGFFYE